MKILIADDDPVTRPILETAARKWGYDVLVAADGKAAWEALQADPPPSIAILDWMMPGIDGADLCRVVRASQREHYIYLILLTIRKTRDDAVAGLDAGADDYITKPPDLEELRARVRVGERVVTLQRSLAGANRKLAILATTDGLTGVLNRNTIVARLGEELTRSCRHRHPVAVAMVDIDHFKQVNDLHGHRAGDTVLTQFARRLRGGARLYDQIGRYGGEEFLLVFPETDLDSAHAAAERVRAQIADIPFLVDTGEPVTLTASFGVAEADLDADPTVDGLIAAADHALYHAKQQGRNRVCAIPTAPEPDPLEPQEAAR